MAPLALNDGDPETVWAQGGSGDGRGEVLSARSAHRGPRGGGAAGAAGRHALARRSSWRTRGPGRCRSCWAPEAGPALRRDPRRRRAARPRELPAAVLDPPAPAGRLGLRDGGGARGDPGLAAPESGAPWPGGTSTCSPTSTGKGASRSWWRPSRGRTASRGWATWWRWAPSALPALAAAAGAGAGGVAGLRAGGAAAAGSRSRCPASRAGPWRRPCPRCCGRRRRDQERPFCSCWRGCPSRPSPRWRRCCATAGRAGRAAGPRGARAGRAARPPESRERAPTGEQSTSRTGGADAAGDGPRRGRR